MVSLREDFARAVLTFYGMPEEDLDQFAKQCIEVGELYLKRDRPAVWGFLGALATTARHQAVERRRGDEAATTGIFSPQDETAPPNHRRDDIGTMIAWALRLQDAPETRPGVRVLWQGIADQLSGNRQTLDDARGDR